MHNSLFLGPHGENAGFFQQIWGELLERTLARHHPDAVVTPSLIPYGTDGNAFRLRGATTYGFSPLVVSLEVVSSMHGDAEHVPVDAFRRGVRVFAEIVADYAGRGE